MSIEKTALESWNDPYDVRDVSLAEDVIEELEKSLALSRRDYDVMFQLHNGLEEQLTASQEQVKVLRDAVETLIAVRRYKIKYGKDEFYRNSRNEAWQKAEQAVATTPEAGK